MSKKIVLQVPISVTVRDRDVLTLHAIARRQQKHGEGVELSVKTLAKELDVSVDTARRALASCEEAGYLAARANQLKNGGQAENTYVIYCYGGERSCRRSRCGGLLDLLPPCDKGLFAKKLANQLCERLVM